MTATGSSPSSRRWPTSIYTRIESTTCRWATCSSTWSCASTSRPTRKRGDHFSPRARSFGSWSTSFIRAKATSTNRASTGEIFDPACGTGGMLSESEKFIVDQNEDAHLALFGQEYNDESWAICCSDMLIKDEDTSNIVRGDTLGDGKTGDGFGGRKIPLHARQPALRCGVERPKNRGRGRA